MGERTPPGPFLRVIETVGCLACGATYAKPRLGGTAATKPGCPKCGYLGWASVTPGAAPAPPHFYADPRPPRLAPPRGRRRKSGEAKARRAPRSLPFPALPS